MSKMIEFLPDGWGRVGKRSYSFTRIEMPRGELNFSQTRNLFYLQDFYDLLNEEGEITIWQKGGPIEPQTSTYQKVYTMGPGIDFPLLMNYSAEEQQSSRSEEKLPFTLHTSRSTTNYFYFLNGHGDVTYFADANFTPEQIETYEYTPWGVLLTSASKNNLLYTSREFDFETGLQFNRNRYYNSNLGKFMYKDQIKTIDLFKYASNSPMNFYDPFGNSIYMTCFIGPIFPSCKGWQWASYAACMAVCAAISSFFQSICASNLAKCIDNCPDFDANCLEGCHNDYFWCMVAVVTTYCVCANECKSICGEEYIDIDFDISAK